MMLKLILKCTIYIYIYSHAVQLHKSSGALLLFASGGKLGFNWINPNKSNFTQEANYERGTLLSCIYTKSKSGLYASQLSMLVLTREESFYVLLLKDCFVVVVVGFIVFRYSCIRYPLCAMSVGHSVEER